MSSLLFVVLVLAVSVANNALADSVHLPLFARDGPALPATNASSGSSSLAYSTDKQSYYVVMRTGQINFRVAIDTGSADLWLLSSDCKTDACNGLPRYPLAYQNPTFSSVNSNATSFSVSYADASGANGYVARESVTLANLTVPNQAFGMATESNVSFVDLTSGVFGLGFPRLSTISQSTTNATPFLSNLASQGSLAYPLFGVSLTRDGSGSLSLGAVDSSVVTNVSNIAWNKVVEFSPQGAESNTSSYLHWAMPMGDILVNGTVITPQPTYPSATNNVSIALLDLGTSGIYGPLQDVSRIFSSIPGARLVDELGQWAVPCDTEAPMAFSFGTQRYFLQPTDYLIGPTSGNPNLCLSWPRALPSGGDGLDWQLGSPFLRTVYSVYSFGINSKESPMIGLYPVTNNTTPESSSAIDSLLASASATIDTTLPNMILPSPTFTTPPYGLNTSVLAPTGGIVSSALATSTYSAIIKSKFNASALPTISPSPTIYTLLVTNSVGVVLTSTSTAPTPSYTLGVPPGWTGGTNRLYVPPLLLSLSIAFVPALALLLS